MYDYRAKIVKVVDGDTVDVDIDLGFGVWLQDERVRLVGVDTPESRTRDLTEKVFGLAAKEFVKNFVEVEGADVQLVTSSYDSKGKFGRILGDIHIDGKPLTSALLDSHMAVIYNAENKALVQEAHLENRKDFIRRRYCYLTIIKFTKTVDIVINPVYI